MKIVIFAGGVGTRLWPLSRKNTPKQFGKIIGERSTLQETVDRLQPDFSFNNIYIATGRRYEEIVRDQLPDIPAGNFIFEPEMRDVGPAIALVSGILAKKYPDEPVAILWSDHLVKNISAFKKVLHMAEEEVKAQRANFVFLAQKPRFANQNMGWIEIGDEQQKQGDVSIYEMKRVIYRPSLDDAKAFFTSGKYVWNLGYFVTTPKYLFSLFESFSPQLHSVISDITKSKTDDFYNTLSKLYSTIEKISFDDAVLVKMKPDHTLVISADLGWSDIGAWESLKEALSKTEDENITKGEVLLENSSDVLAFNFSKQLTVGIDLEHLLVINTDDVLLICPKTSVPKIKKLVESLSGTPHEHLT